MQHGYTRQHRAIDFIAELSPDVEGRVYVYTAENTSAANGMTITTLNTDPLYKVNCVQPILYGVSGEEGIYYSHQTGRKKYEIKNHLGNVHLVVSDKKVGQDSLGGQSGDGIIDHYTTINTDYYDYYPFAWFIQDRNYNLNGVDGAYRFGFQGQEKDDEVSGTGNSYTAQFWQYDPRLGRRWNLDPKPNPSISQNAAFANNPIIYIDPLGDTLRFSTFFRNSEFFSKFLSDMKNTTGLLLSLDEKGNMNYKINEDASNYSKRARKRLIKLIDRKKVITTDIGNESTGGGTEIVLSPTYIENDMLNLSPSLNKNTVGYAMTWFHESYHCGFFSIDDTEEKWDKGFTVRATNKIRRQLGYSERYNYQGIYIKSQKPIIIKQTDFDIEIYTYYIRYSVQALKKLSKGEVPSNGVLIIYGAEINNKQNADIKIKPHERFKN